MALKLLNAGFKVQYHHAGLCRKVRKQVENAFRSRELDALICTPTIEMGVNLPAARVILYDLQSYSMTNGYGEFKPLPVNNVWQRVGRAGRPGMDTTGEAVLFVPSWEKIPQQYEKGTFEPIISGLWHIPSVADQIVTEVASGMARTEKQIEDVFATSLAALQGKLPRIAPIVRQMVDAGMLKETDESTRTLLKATRLGRAACRHLLSPKSILQLKSVADRNLPLTFFDLLLLVASTHDCEPVLMVNMEELENLSTFLGRERSCLLAAGQEEATKILDVKGKRLLSSIKMALVLQGWTRTGDEDVVAESLDCSPYEVKMLAEVVERLLLALREIVAEEEEEPEQEPSWPNDDNGPRLPERIATLTRMIVAGLDNEAATLTMIDGIGPTITRRLLAAGITDIESLANATEEEIATVKGISQQRAKTWVAEAEVLAKTRSAFWFNDNGPRIVQSEYTWPIDLDPYRFRRSMDLQVTSAGDDAWRVTGGLDPHLLTMDGSNVVCDCDDHSKGNLCKHIMAVQRYMGAKEMIAAENVFARRHANDALCLAQLWENKGNCHSLY